MRRRLGAAIATWKIGPVARFVRIARLRTSRRWRKEGSGARADPAIPHHEDDAGERLNVSERVAIYGNQVGAVADLDLADLVSQAERLRRVDRRSANGVDRRNAGRHERRELS